MKCNLKLLLLLGAIPLFLMEAVGQDNTPKYSNEFLTLGVGARAFGMGAQGVAFVNDVTSGYWNPAGLLRVSPDHQLMLMHSSYFAGIANYDFGAFTTRVADSSRIAFSVIRFSVDDIPDTRFLFDADGRIDYSRIQFFSASDYAFLVSYAQSVPFLGGVQVGGNVKVIRRIAGDFSKAWGFGFDFGAQKSVRSWQLGLSARDIFGTFNVWSHNDDQFREVFNDTGNDVPVSTTEITLPRLILGIARAFEIREIFSVLGSVELQTTLDGKRNTVIRSNFASIDPSFGLEVGYNNAIFLRFGTGQFQRIKEFSGDNAWRHQPAAGIGFKIRELTIDYALTDVGDQAEGLYSHVFSIKVDFNEKGS